MFKSIKISKKRYNRTTYFYDHVEEFEAHLDALGVADRAKCKAFPITFEGNMGNWFRSLPAGSIALFKDLR